MTSNRLRTLIACCGNGQRLGVRSQFLRYGIVGMVSNVAAYCLYLVITSFSIKPVLGMSIVYLIAASTSYLLNKVWTFTSTAKISWSLLKYCGVQCVGYVSNVIVLVVLHYVLGVPHYLAQLAGILVVAIVLFILCRSFVFA